MKTTILRSSRGFNGGQIKVYVGHKLVWSKKWTSIDQMLSIEAAVRELLAPKTKLYLVRGA